ncbi:MAG: T9SS type A sorting domain-containing protein [Saprospiraceae bacterium]|nr:T9SS type A sorting domain-containing protein [Saprospiraceae bacterium]
MPYRFLFVNFVASAQSFDLGSQLTGASPIQTTNGCTSACSSYCSPTGSGDHAATVCSGTISVPGNKYVSIVLSSNNCNPGTSGLDGGDNVTIMGANLPQAPYAGNELVSYSTCYYNPNSSAVDVTIQLTVNRRDETVNVAYTVFNSDPGGGCIAMALLPVELTNFEAKESNGGIMVSWATASEVNNEFQSLERSYDGSRFEEIKRFNGGGNSLETKAYKYFDSAPSEGIVYYRIHQVDYDGTENYSKVVAVSHFSSKSAITVFPTNVMDVFTVRFDNPTQKNGTIELVGMQGRSYYVQAFEAETPETSLNIQNLPTGQYLVKISTDQFVESRRIIKN